MMPGKHRKHIIQTTLNDREYALFVTKAEHEGMSMAAWARVLLVRGCRPDLSFSSTPDTALVQSLVGEHKFKA